MSPVPRTLGVRLFLLLLCGVLAAVFVTSSLALREGGRAVRQVREEGAAQRLADFLYLLAALAPDQRIAVVNQLPSGRWRIAVPEAAGPPPVPRAGMWPRNPDPRRGGDA